eukprot:ANDGO_06802.mRNA.1 Retrovirus-related Pol polyprotein from transposon TNT 1-94
MDSIRKNDVYELNELPQCGKAIGCRWIFRTKKDANGNVERYKARLVASGYGQNPGIDFTEAFAPVAKFSSIRTILAIAALERFEVHQMDVKTAFLNGNLEEEVFMEQSDGTIEKGKEKLVWILKKLEWRTVAQLALLWKGRTIKMDRIQWIQDFIVKLLDV